MEPVLIECFYGWLYIPYFFKQEHVLTFQVMLGLPFPEGFSCGFGLPQQLTEMFNFTFVGHQSAPSLFLDRFDNLEMFLVFLLCLFLVKLILIDGPRCDY